MFIPPRRASRTVIFLYTLLISLDTKITTASIPKNVYTATGMLTGWFQESPSTELTMLPNVLIVNIDIRIPIAEPIAATIPISIVSAHLSSLTVYPAASIIPVFFIFLWIKFLILKDMIIRPIIRMMAPNNRIMAIAIIGTNNEPPFIISQLIRKYCV